MVWVRWIGPALLLLLLATPGASATVREIDLGGAPALEVVEQSEHSLTFAVRVGRLVAEELNTPAGAFTRLCIPGFHRALNVGRPALPMLKRCLSVAIRDSIPARQR